MKRNKLKQIRKKRKLTQQEIAERCGVARSTYTGVECGLVDPSYKLTLKIKRALQYKKDDLFSKGE